MTERERGNGGDDAGRAAAGGTAGWYDLFSRGARDWLRHNEKIREAVRANLPDIIARSDVAGPGGQVVRPGCGEARRPARAAGPRPRRPPARRRRP